MEVIEEICKSFGNGRKCVLMWKIVDYCPTISVQETKQTSKIIC